MLRALKLSPLFDLEIPPLGICPKETMDPQKKINCKIVYQGCLLLFGH